MIVLRHLLGYTPGEIARAARPAARHRELPSAPRARCDAGACCEATRSSVFGSRTPTRPKSARGASCLPRSRTREPVPRPRRDRAVAITVALAAVGTGARGCEPAGDGCASTASARSSASSARRGRSSRSPRRAGCSSPPTQASGSSRQTEASVSSPATGRRAGRPSDASSWRTQRNELAALEPDGHVRWTLARPRRRVRRAGAGRETDTRIAYVDRTGIRVVAGDGDRRPAPRARRATGPLAWRPGATSRARVRLRRARCACRRPTAVMSSGARVAARPSSVRALAWSDDGRRLLVLSPARAPGLRRRGAHRSGIPSLDGSARYTDAAFVPGTHRVRRAARRDRRCLFLDTGRHASSEAQRPRQRVPPAPERAAGCSSPGRGPTNGSSSAPAAALRAVADVTEQFRSRSGFPRVQGWCCARRLRLVRCAPTGGGDTVVASWLPQRSLRAPRARRLRGVRALGDVAGDPARRRPLPRSARGGSRRGGCGRPPPARLELLARRSPARQAPRPSPTRTRSAPRPRRRRTSRAGCWGSRTGPSRPRSATSGRTTSSCS